MILSSEIDIDSNENAGHLHDRLMHLGSETVINTFRAHRRAYQKKMLQIKSAHENDKDNH
jgi:methionyl-tRNA formyltransferase